MNIALITSIYGGYDTLRALPPEHGFSEAICVTDSPDLASPGWTVIVRPSGSDLDPRLAAKEAKCLPWEFTTLGSSVWIDGSMQVQSGALCAVAETYLSMWDLVVRQHPSGRVDVFEEAEFCQTVIKYNTMPLLEQVDNYKRRGLPVGSGLWECGVILRNHTSLLQQFGLEWYVQQARWSVQDQLSFPYLCWKYGVVPGAWQFDLWNNAFVQWRPHSDGT